MLLTAVTFFFILSVLVFIHEFGHFIVARWVGVRVEEFGFGLPPRIWGKKVKGTIYSVNWLPIGGFVKLTGEDDTEIKKVPLKVKSLKQYFWARSKKERSAILLAGVFMNFFLAVGITAFLLLGGVEEPSGRVHVESIQSASPAEKAGLKQSDILVSISRYPIRSGEDAIRIKKSGDLIGFVKANAGHEVAIDVVRNGKSVTVKTTPRSNPPPGQGPLGVVVSDLELKTYSALEAPPKAVEINLSRAHDMFVSLGTTLWRLINFKPPQGDIAGPIGIAEITGTAVKFGWKAVLEFMSILSLNLAVINVLPFPALDGGRLLFVFLEKLFGRRVKPAFERSAHQLGMLILFALILLISMNDILRLARGG